MTSLLASTTSFTALAASQPLTWGDSRHSHLGRQPSSLAPASSPSAVLSLGGIPIRKIYTGGWNTAAVSCENDLYVWGGRPGETEKIAALPTEGEEVSLVDIEGGVDVVDAAIGEKHMIAVTREGNLWVTGEGKWGQLGTGRRIFEKGWIHVTGFGGKRIIGVACGFWSSFVIIRKSGE